MLEPFFFKQPLSFLSLNGKFTFNMVKAIENNFELTFF
jgi:hypothetical protein